MSVKKIRPSKQLLPKLIIIGLIVIILVITIVSSILNRYSPGTEYADLKEFYNVSNDESAIFINGERADLNGVIKDGRVYLPLTMVNDDLGGRFYYSDEGLLLYAMPTQLVSITALSSTYQVGDTQESHDFTIFFIENDEVYLEASFLQNFTAMNIEEYSEPSRLIIDTIGGETTVVSVDKDTKVRYQAGIKSPILSDVQKGESVKVLEQLDDWTKVYYNGVTGYVESKTLGEEQIKVVSLEGDTIVYSNISQEDDVLLVWHQVFDEAGNQTLQTSLSTTQGVNTISPTWFSIADNEGNITSLASRSYVDTAHAMGIQVWGLVDDFSENKDNFTVLSTTSSRRNLINNIISQAESFGLDGINIDFEYVTEACGEHFLQFIRELSIECRSRGLVLSIDNYVPAGGRTWYDLNEQGIIADYVILMGYDEHWAGSQSAGSTASISFTRTGIENTLLLVAQDKLIHAMPFYTRVWKETPESLVTDNSQIIVDGTSYYGRYALTSQAAGMTEAANLLSENGANLSWLEAEGQYYGEYELDSCLYRIWLEDVTSLKEKMNVVAEHDLAGVAFWKLTLESPDVWEMINQYLNQ